MRKLLFAVIAFIAGCATATKTYLPSGAAGYNIDCSGTASSWGKCYEKAGSLCGSSGYKVISKEGDTGAAIAGNSLGLYGGTTISRTLLVSCGGGG